MPNAGLDPRIRRVFEAFDKQDAEAAVAQFADDGIFVETADNETFTRDEFREYLADRVFTAFPDYSVTDTEVLTTYDWATVVEYTFQATHDGPLGETPPTGNTVTLSIVAVITVTDDGIATWRDYTNSERFAKQVGIN